MNTAQTRSIRIETLRKMLLRLILDEGMSPNDAMSMTRDRAYKMVSKSTAEEYLAEVVRRVSK